MPKFTSKPPSSSLSSAPDASPLHLQLARQLALDIHGGRYRADQALPSERVLAQSLAMSRVSALKAIAVLVAQGLVLCHHGSGKFIAPQLEQTSTSLTGFSEELRQRGYVSTSTWIVREACTANAAACMQLQLGAGAQIARLDRLRQADGTPMAVEVTVLPIAALPQPQALDGTLYKTLTTTPYAPVRAVQHISACNADVRVAEQLGVPIATALLWVSRTAYLASGAPVEYTASHCRSDYYDFVVELLTPPCST